MKKVILLFVLLSCLFGLFACNKKTNELDIIAADAYNVPAGEYTLQYSITDYEKYRDDYHLVVTVNVYDEDNNALGVLNNRTVYLSNGKKYTVIIRLNGNVNGKDISKFKQFRIETIPDDVTVKFYLKDGLFTTPHASYTLGYGESIPLDEVPEIPLYYAAQNDLEGHVRTITDKKWVVYEDKDHYHDLSEDDLKNITESFSVYSFYTYEDRIVENTVTFESNGGTPKEPIKGTVNDTLYRPSDIPSKDGYVFLGWCVDDELTTYYNWRQQKTISSDMTLYAKWAKDNSSEATGDNYFDFKEEQDNFGNPYYSLSPKDKERITGDLVLPSCHNSLPVRELTSGAFSHTSISSVYVPETYSLGISRAFASCTKLTAVEFEKGNLRDNLDTYVLFDCPLLTSVVLSENLTTLDEGCFSGCLRLSDVVLPDKVELINEKAFFGCASLSSVALPDSVKTIAAHAYENCSSLETFTVTENSQLKSIAPSAFNGTAIKNLTLPNSLQDQVSLDNDQITIGYFSPSQKE